MCQSPIYQDTHFYGGLFFGKHLALAMCQSPIYQDTHFYDSTVLANCRNTCVNPLSIGSPISTLGVMVFLALRAACQSPIYRVTHFYRWGHSMMIWQRN